MDDRVKQGIKTFGPPCISFVIANSVTFFSNWLLWQKLIFGIVSNIVCCIIFVFCMEIHDGYLGSLAELWKIGKIKGLWKGKGLRKQIEKVFLNASEIKIKVTRGVELLDSENPYSIKQILNTIHAQTRSEQRHVTIKILLIEPCFQLKHVQDRFKRHEGNMKEKDFIQSWYDFLKELHRNYHPHDYFSYEIKFYSGRHSKWRFYICNTHERNGTTVLLSNYDVKTSGSSTPMYKIIKGDSNIGGFMDRYFDEIWQESLTEEQLKNHIMQGSCKRFFCETCFTCGYQENCEGCEQCKYAKMCKDIINNYK